MSDLLWLSKTQMRRIEPFVPLSHGAPRVDDRRIVSGIIFVIRNGLRWCDAPAAYGPHKGYDADWLRTALAQRGIAACIPSKANRKVPIPHDTALYRRRHKIEIMFGRLNQGLAPHPHPLRSMRAHFHVRHLHRGDRHLLAQSMSPEPSWNGCSAR